MTSPFLPLPPPKKTDAVPPLAVLAAAGFISLMPDPLDPGEEDVQALLEVCPAINY